MWKLGFIINIDANFPKKESCFVEDTNRLSNLIQYKFGEVKNGTLEMGLKKKTQFPDENEEVRIYD